jgi:hypothetical protein
MLYMALSNKMAKYKEKGAGRSGSTDKPFDEVGNRFIHNPKGDALFASRVVKALARSTHYALRAFPSGANKNCYRAMRNITWDTP